MGSMSFSDVDKKDVVAEVVPVEIVDDNNQKALSVAPPRAIYVEDEDAEGEFSAKDIIWPSLTLVTKTSSQAEEFGIGTWLLNKETPVGKFDKPLKVIAVKIQKAYQEILPYGAGRPRIFRTMQEVYDAGLQTEDWQAANRAAEVLGVRFWIPQPEGVDAPHVFVIEGPEGPGTVAKFFAARTTHGTVGKTLSHARATNLSKARGGLASGMWEMYATKETRNGNSWLLPRLRPAGKTPEPLANFLRELGV